MERLENEQLTDAELSEMLAAWTIPVPSRELRARIFSGRETSPWRASFQVPANIEEPWYKSIIKSIRETLHPPKLPPLEVTSKPIEVGTIWGAYPGHQGRWSVIAAASYVGVIALVCVIFQTPVVQRTVKESVHLVYSLPEFKPKRPPTKTQAGGGGGGGQKNPLPVSKGAAPKLAPKQFVMPELVHMVKPNLPVAPTITAPAPQIVADNYGDPLATSTLLSGGPGIGGLGTGHGGGIGSGNGDGYGPGNGGGTGGGAYRIGGDVSAPQIVSKIEPEYSEEARRAKYSGSVLLSIIVDEHGLPRDIRVIRPLGLGLDEKAVEAVSKWRFIAGRKGGRPVATQAEVEVNFRLL